MKLKNSLPIFLILLFSFLIRLIFLLITRLDTILANTPDTFSYLHYANAILDGHFWDYPSALRTPIYPLFMAVFQLKTIPIILAQMILSVITVFITYQIAKMVFHNDKIAL